MIHAWSHPLLPSHFPLGRPHPLSRWGKFLLAIPPAIFPLTGSLKLDPGEIQKLAPLTTQQESQFDYLTPVVASHEAESLAPFVLPRIRDQALSR